METSLGGGATQLTPLTTGRDNRSVTPNTAAEIQPSCGSSAKARMFPQVQRALVCLRDGLTADSTRRTLPELKRGDQTLPRPAAPTIHRNSAGGPAHGYLQI